MTNLVRNFPKAHGLRFLTFYAVISVHYLAIRLFALDFYEVIVDEAAGRINYRLIEIESE